MLFPMSEDSNYEVLGDGLGLKCNIEFGFGFGMKEFVK